MGPFMTVAIAEPVSRPASDVSTFDFGGAQVRAHCRHLATVVTIRGEIDGLNVDRIGEHIRRFILEQTHLVLDMSDVSHFAPAGISLLHMLDEDCRAAEVEWTLVASPAVIELLGDGSEPMFMITGSAHAALRKLADAIASRRQLVLPLIAKTA
jgi:anti-anti-sigma factor